MTEKDDALLEEALDWWLGNEALNNEFEDFAGKHCSKFPDPNPDGSPPEQSQDSMLLYNTFQEMVEGHIEGFLKNKGISAEDLGEVCQRVEEKSGGDSHPFVLWMLATTSYEQFWRMMIEEKEKDK